MAARHILIADDDILFREGLETVLDEYFTVWTSDAGPEAVALVDGLAPDVVLVNPESKGLEAARQIKARHPLTRVILLSVYDRYLTAALDVGADGYLLKGCPTEELVAAINRPAGVAEPGSSKGGMSIEP
ncbi:MAG TPA: response regulator transcription factor [Anaerolineae bacterium]|nr:response regulator transcription factor [Anaerolineae bacterium]